MGFLVANRHAVAFLPDRLQLADDDLQAWLGANCTFEHLLDRRPADNVGRGGDHGEVLGKGRYQWFQRGLALTVCVGEQGVDQLVHVMNAVVRLFNYFVVHDSPFLVFN
ncbi:hypothetical protein D3C81_1569870 [compost metagenome]